MLENTLVTVKGLVHEFAKWLMRLTCAHKSKESLEVDYQERYSKEVCSDCGKEIYEDM